MAREGRLQGERERECVSDLRENVKREQKRKKNGKMREWEEITEEQWSMGKEQKMQGKYRGRQKKKRKSRDERKRKENKEMNWGHYGIKCVNWVSENMYVCVCVLGKKKKG